MFCPHPQHFCYELWSVDVSVYCYVVGFSHNVRFSQRHHYIIPRAPTISAEMIGARYTTVMWLPKNLGPVTDSRPLVL